MSSENQKSSRFQGVTLAGTKWLIKGTKGGFCPFIATFNDNGTVDCKTTNGYFSTTYNYTEDGNNFHMDGDWVTPGGTTQDSYLGSFDGTTGSGHYSFKGSNSTQIGQFTMTEQQA